jgi:hypothetical protein
VDVSTLGTVGRTQVLLNAKLTIRVILNAETCQMPVFHKDKRLQGINPCSNGEREATQGRGQFFGLEARTFATLIERNCNDGVIMSLRII